MGPIGVTLGERYRLDEELGRGGMGIVYRARDAALGRDVAVKLLSDTNLSEEAGARLLREAKIIAQLDHPNIVTVYDVGDYQGSPFIVMQLLDGCTLRDRPPNSLDEALKIITQICAALEHAHRQGIIHRDLKPENIAISADGTVRLMDFGLARPLVSRMTAEGAIVGTVHYMAPEQLLGKELDQRADLYALGVMSYELTTGRLPFEADNPVAVITQHLNAPVVPPRARCEALPVHLDQLILKLLEKDPSNRPESASKVLQMLEEPEAQESLPVESRELSLIDRIVRGRLVGRAQELAEVDSLWRRAIQGQGQLLLISGEPGIGKTRLVREIVTRVEVSGCMTSVGECYPEGSAPYAPFAQMIRSWLRSKPINDWSADIAPREHVLAALLTLTPDLKPDFPDISASTPLDPKLEQQRLLESMTSYVRALSERAPVLLVVEDVQWADSNSLSMLRHLARRLRRRPVLMAVTYREVELDEALPLSQLLMDLNRERLATRMKLKRLDPQETRTLLATLFAAEITPEFASGIYRETEGNPFFVEEVCKALIDSGQLTHVDGAWQRPPVAQLNIPQSIRIAIQSRVAHLSQENQETLCLAALLGREFDFATLVATRKLSEITLIDSLEAAERAHLIEEVSNERGGTFRFTHALIPATLPKSLSRLRRRRLHKQVAEVLEELRPDDVGSLAYHWDQAADDTKAFKYHTMAGELASNAYANQEAERHFRAALTLASGSADQANLLTELGEVVARQGDYQDAAKIWRRGIALCEASGDLDQVARLYARSSHAISRGGNPKLGLTIAQQGLQTVANAPDSPGLAELLHQIAHNLLYQGESAKGEALARRSLQVAERTEALTAQVRALRLLGTFASLPQNEAAVLLERAAKLAHEHHLLDEEMMSRNNLGVVYGDGLGKWDQAIEQVSKAGELARMMGDRSMELHCGTTVVWLLSERGDLEAAGELLSALDLLSDEIGESGLAYSLLEVNRAVLQRYFGHRPQAIKQLREIYKAAVAVNDTNVIFMSGSSLAHLLIEMDQNLAEAKHAATKAVELSYGSAVLQQSLLVVVLARCGEVEQATQQFERAKESYSEMGRLTEQPFLFWAQAELARKQGQQEVFLSGLENAVELFDQCGMRWYRAFMLLQLADAMAPGQVDARRRLLHEASIEFEAIGALIYAKEARARLRPAQAGS